MSEYQTPDLSDWILDPGINGNSDQILAIYMRADTYNIASNFKGKYK